MSDQPAVPEIQAQSNEGVARTPRCWASSLGGCSGKMSREHIVTKGLWLDNEVTVSGLPWCAGEGKKVGLASLTTKALCVAHNSALSDVDQEAIRFARVLKESFRLLEVRSAIRARTWRMKRFVLDGQKIERWLLKTLINATYDRNTPIGPDAHVPGRPSNSLVEIAFGKRAFESMAGLYGVMDALENKPYADGVAIQVINTRLNRVLGAVFSFLGFRLLLFLDRSGPSLPLMKIGTEGSETVELIEPTYHPIITYNAGNGVSHAIEFKWPKSF